MDTNEEKVQITQECNNKSNNIQDNTEEDIQENISFKKSTNKNSKTLLIIILVLFFVLLLILSTIFALLNINNSKIISGVAISGINISNCSKKEAYKLLEQIFLEKSISEVKLNYKESEYDINLEQIELTYNIEEAINEAYNWGRNDNIFINNYKILYATIFNKDIPLNILYNEDLIIENLKNIESNISGAIQEPDYYIENDTLVITKGKEGLAINKDIAIKNILNNIKSNKNDVIALMVELTKPSSINIEKIHEKVFTEPKNAEYTKEPFEIFPEVNGIDFNIEEAKKILKEDKEEYKIKLNITVPKVKIGDIGVGFAPDLLGGFSTKYDASNIGRSTNLKLASDKINGTIVMPGEIFSYNKVVGERTAAKGYKMAGVYSGGKVVNGIGGGICQISSTLYNAAIYANLEIVNRKNHAFLTSYVAAGRDATVVYGAIDFQFKNTRKYPIKIVSSVQNGIAKMEIYGIKEDVEYEVEIDAQVLSYKGFQVVYEDSEILEPGKTKVIQNGIRGCTSVTYKILKLNGIEVSKEKISADTYNACSKIIQKGIEIVETPVEVPTETPVESANEVIEETIQQPTELPQNETITPVPELPQENVNNVVV